MEKVAQPDHWDRLAEAYEKTGHPHTAVYAETALSYVPLSQEQKVLDVAAGTGALALAAARTGAQVVATDFSAAMLARIENARLPNVQVAVMDGQALTLADDAFDAVFSIFGVFMFPDWRKGLSEMARVTRPGGHGVVATWQGRGAGAYLLLGQLISEMFPEQPLSPFPEGARLLSDAGRFAEELESAGYRDPRIHAVTRAFPVERATLDSTETLFHSTPDWNELNEKQRSEILAEIKSRMGDEPRLDIPSTALIGVAKK